MTEGPWTLSIANGQTASPAFSSLFATSGPAGVASGAGRLALWMARWLRIAAPAALTGAITIQVASSWGGTDWTTLQNEGTDVALAAGKANDFEPGGMWDFRIVSTLAEAAQRDFVITADVC